MPGIAGIIRKGTKENEEDLKLMIECMMHETFYTSGTYANDKVMLYVGWISHEGSFSDCMPVVNEKKDLILIFSGENFIDKQITNELKEKGHTFDHSNASYLIHLYEEDEKRFLEKLNGWFSGILVDLRKEKVVLFNDRYGVNRIYYYEGKEEFLFSSEAKALLKVRPKLRKIDMRSLGEFFACDCVLENRSLFSDIFLLPGGSSWTFHKSGEVKKDHYFKPGNWENQSILKKEDFYNKLRETFLSILPRYFQGRQSIAMSLTSGIDTRAVMANSDNLIDELPCYTFSGIYGDTLDVIIARKVAEVCHQTHQVVRLDKDFLSDFPNLADKTIYVTDGCHEVCGSHDIYFNAHAREIAPIRMTGKFGSEVIGSHSMFKSVITLREDLFNPDFKEYIDKAVRTFEEIKNQHRLSFTVFKEIPWHEFGRLALEKSKLTFRTPYMDNEIVRLMYQAPIDARTSMAMRLRLIEDGNSTLRRIMTDRGTAGESNYLFSKFAQVFYYFLFKEEYIYLFQLPHWLTKVDCMLALLHPEKLLAGRYQLGYYRIWFRNELCSYIQDILMDKRSEDRTYLSKGVLNRIVRDHIKGNRNYTSEINKTLSAELIHRLLIENS